MKILHYKLIGGPAGIPAKAGRFSSLRTSNSKAYNTVVSWQNTLSVQNVKFVRKQLNALVSPDSIYVITDHYVAFLATLGNTDAISFDTDFLIYFSRFAVILR